MGLESDLQWRDAVCYGAEKCSWPAEHHTKAGLPVCREQALKSVGERNTHGGCRYGDLRETARAREAAPRGGVKRLCMV
jgi:hypothetical protein